MASWKLLLAATVQECVKRRVRGRSNGNAASLGKVADHLLKDGHHMPARG
jgi:hypothetical protein